MNVAASVERLCQIKDVTEEDAELIRAIWKATNDTELQALDQEKYDKYVRQLYNPTSLRDVKRHMIDAVLDTFGVEYLGQRRRTHEHVYYCNAGDTYTGTILFIGDRLEVGCWGDLVERKQIIERERQW